MLRCDRSAAMASSCLRPSFEPCPAIRCHLAPTGELKLHRQSFAARHNLLAFPANQSDSCDRGNTAYKGENIMISTAEALENALAPAAEAPKAKEKASVAKRGAHV